MPEELNQSTTIPSTPPSDPVVSTPDFASVVPQGFGDKPYMKEIDSFDKLFNQFDNAQTMLGKRPGGIPQTTDGEDKWNAFYKEMGRPETADKYEFDVTEGFERNSDLESQVKSLMHEVGLSADQAKKLQIGYDSLMMGLLNKNKESTADKDKAMNLEFETLTKTHFGERQEEALKTSKALLAKLAPAEFHNHINQLDNKSLVALAVVLDKVNEKFITEDDGGGSGDDPEGVNLIDLQAKAREMMASKEHSDQFHPRHESVVQEVRGMYKQIAKMKRASQAQK